MARRGDTFSATHWPRSGFPARRAAASAAYTPLAETDIAFYWDPDVVGTGVLSALTDQSTGGHNLSQGTAGKRATNTATQFGSHRGLVYPAASSNGGYVFDTPWAKGNFATAYSIVKYVDNANYQILWVGDAATGGVNLGPVMRISFNAGDAGKPTISHGSNRASAAAAMANGSTHLIKFGWDFNLNQIYVAVDGGAKVTAAQDGNAGSYYEQSLSSLNTQCCASVLGVQVICSGWHDGDAEDVRITDYLKTWAGIA